MSENSIYSKGLILTVIILVTVLVGTIITVFIPLAMDSMHPKFNGEYNYTALELAGRDVYKAEGCINCHSQLVRPLKADVLRYGEVTQPAESAYERPFMWGSKRTGPDLARVGGVYSDEWQKAHLINPQAFFPKSNMPKYDWLANQKVDVEEAIASAEAYGIKGTHAELQGKTKLDALVAYLQMLGTKLPYENTHKVEIPEEYATTAKNVYAAGGKEAMGRGAELFDLLCKSCHGVTGKKSVAGMDITNMTFADALTDMSDGEIFITIANGIPGSMPNHFKIMSKNDIWMIAAYLRTISTQAMNK